MRTAPAIPEHARQSIERWIEVEKTPDLRIIPATVGEPWVSDIDVIATALDGFPEPIVLYREREARWPGRLVRDCAVRADTREIVARGQWYYRPGALK